MLLVMSARKPDRPLVVDWFETLSIVVLGFEVAFLGVTWDDLFWVPLLLWNILSVTRRRSSVARWIFSAIYGAGFVIMVWLAAAGMIRLADMEWTGWMLSVASIVQLILLWSSATSEWLASSRRSATPV
jgi:hypothetical protein